jgi:hypothetical protein
MGKNKAVDQKGFSWTFDKIWIRDYVKPKINQKELLNQQKIEAIKKLGYDHSDAKEVFGYSRTDLGFAQNLDLQSIEGQKTMNLICPKCQSEHFEEINEVFSYNIPASTSKLRDPEILLKMNQEDKKAQEFLRTYLEKLYPGKVFD